MLVKMFAVYDSKAEAYMMPQYYNTAGLAERAFTQAVNTADTQFFSCPEDFTLFELGTYDDHGAVFDIYAAPVCVVKAIQVKRVDS